MAFWSRKEDPWDRDPAKERARREREPVENPLDTLRGWNERRKAEAAEREAALAAEPAETCPWCGRDMERGYFATGRGGIVWTPGRRTGRSAWVGPPREARDRQLRVDDEGAIFTYKTVWYCSDCAKMVLDAAGLQHPVNTPLFAGEETSEEDP